MVFYIKLKISISFLFQFVFTRSIELSLLSSAKTMSGEKTRYYFVHHKYLGNDSFVFIEFQKTELGFQNRVTCCDVANRLNNLKKLNIIITVPS